jgi:hypothetical protein
MPKIPKIKLAAEYLLKLADEQLAAMPEEQTHEMGEPSSQEGLEHMHTESEDFPAEHEDQTQPEEADAATYTQGEPLEEPLSEDISPEEEQDDAEVEHLISQLTPEQIDDLAAQLAEDIQQPDQNQDEDTSALAQAIQEHLAQNPEASIPEAAPEKIACLNIFKSAEYIEGFLNEALSSGTSIKEAVDLYDSVLADALSFVKTAENVHQVIILLQKKLKKLKQILLKSNIDNQDNEVIDENHSIAEAAIQSLRKMMSL